MPEEFNPYHKWLSIPPKEQPPHHYRLLGLSPFESDPDVIESAADRQMAHIQTYKTGKYSQLSQKLLNEISSAKLTLLNKDKKQAYDAKLRNQLGAKKPPQNKPAAKPKKTQTTAAPKIVTEPVTLTPAHETISPTVLYVAVGTGVVAVLIIGALFVSMLGGSDEPVVVNPSPNDKNPPVTKKKDDTEQNGKSNDPGTAEKNPPVRPPVVPPPVKPPIEVPPVDPVKPPVVPPKDPVKPPKDPPDNPPVEPPKTLTVEEVATQADALEQRRSAAKTAAHFKQLAADSLTLAQQALEAGHKEAALRVARLTLVTARKSGDPELIRKATLLVIAIQEGKSVAAPDTSRASPATEEATAGVARVR